SREGLSQRAIDLELILGMENAGFQFVRGKAVSLFQLARVVHNLIDGPDIILARAGIRIAEETIGCKADAVAESSAEDPMDRRLPSLAENIQTGKFQSRQRLRPIVIE